MNKSAYPSDQQDKFMLRLPDGMRDRIKAAAEANNRSMNAEIVAMLGRGYPPPPSEMDRLVFSINDLTRRHVMADTDAEKREYAKALKKVWAQLAEHIED